MKLNNKGFTLVEVMAGFSLLVVLMVSFVKIIKLSSDLTNAAIATKNSTTEFYEKYYSGDNYHTDDNKIAFRKSNGTNNTVDLPIIITEVTSNSSDAETINTSYNLTTRAKNIVKLKIIENINDKNASRIAVYRYVRAK